MKKVLITGSNGFIGRNLQEHLGTKYNIFPVSRREADLLDQKQVEQLFRQENIDVVIHSANQGKLGRGRNVDMELKNNLKMFLNMEHCQAYYGKMLLFGSGAEYDKRRDLSLVDEEDFGISIPADGYGLSKYLMSKIITKSDNIYNLRLFGIFGPYENYNYRFISNMICKVLSGVDIVIHQNSLFDYLYIKDFCRIIPWFIEHTPKDKCYNVCTGNRQELVSIAKEILKQANSARGIQVEQDGLNKEYTGSNRRLLKELGTFTFTPMEQAIEEMIDYYKHTPFRLEGDY